jgi:hypothetical protein
MSYRFNTLERVGWKDPSIKGRSGYFSGIENKKKTSTFKEALDFLLFFNT